MPSGGKSYSKAPPGAGRKKNVSYTPSPAVKSNVPGKKGGVWHSSTGKFLGTSKSEDSPRNPRGTKKASTRSVRPR